MRCLSDEELSEVVVGGPVKLAEHTDDRAHQHIVHELCSRCIVRLIEAVMLHEYTREATRH